MVKTPRKTPAELDGRQQHHVAIHDEKLIISAAMA